MPKSPNKPQRPKESDLAPKPIVEVEPFSYQPSRAELREDVSISDYTRGIRVVVW